MNCEVMEKVSDILNQVKSLHQQLWISDRKYTNTFLFKGLRGVHPVMFMVLQSGITSGRIQGAICDAED